MVRRRRRGSRSTPVRALALVALLALVGCGTGPAARWEATRWPEADALFRSEPRWLGADAASSVDLGAGRVLWLFGDTFVAPASAPHAGRAEAALVRNTVAIQRGYDPSSASIAFHWRRSATGPSAFFPGSGRTWRWPLGGLRGGAGLTVFLLREREAPAEEGGFRTVGWEAVRVADPDASPEGWHLRPLSAFESAFPVVVGTSVLAFEGFVYAYAVQEPGNHDVYLLRWSREDFAAGRLAAARFFDGARGWVPQASLGAAPEAVFAAGQTELSVTWDAAYGRFVEVQSRGYGATTVAVRTAPRPEGPWSDPVDVYRPPESGRKGVLVYAAKGHPELEGADLVVTYATNAAEPRRLLHDESLYWPRFVRLSFGAVP